jgi:hypothetical protein
MRFNLGAEELSEAAITVQLSQPFFEQGWNQLFLEVVAKNAAHFCSTFVPPHLGHLTLLSSCSARVKTVENFLPQDVQRYS